MEDTVTEYRSKFGFRVYAGIAVTLPVFYACVPDILYEFGILHTAEPRYYIGTSMAVTLSAVCLAILAFYWALGVHVPRLRFDAGGISIRKLFTDQTYQWSEVRSVDLIARENIAIFLIPENREATKLVFDDGELSIPIDWYRNDDEMRRFLANNPNLSSLISIPNIKPISDKTEVPGIQRFSSPMVIAGMLLGLVVILVFVLLQKTSDVYSAEDAVLIVGYKIGFLVLILVPFTPTLHYFEISGSTLIVRNYVLFWRRSEFSFNTIRDAYVHRLYRRGKALRITTSEFKSKEYIAGSLMEKDWGKLKKTLRGRGFKVSEGSW